MHSLCAFALIASVACALPVAAQEREPPESPDAAMASPPSLPADAAAKPDSPAADRSAPGPAEPNSPTAPIVPDAPPAPPPTSDAEAATPAPRPDPHAVPPLKMDTSMTLGLPMSMPPEAPWLEPLEMSVRDPFAIPSPAASLHDAASATTQSRTFATVWERLKSGFKLPTIDDALVRKWESFYSARPDYWQRINERGRRYLYFIAREIERRGMPLEIALLPVIESAYNPQALSTARALGIWQFVPATGKLYGLAQNWWMDDRRDVGVATAGALDYLEKLHEMFGDWQLALAAYNWGEGAVQRAVNRNRAHRKPTDYASLKIPTETRNYLPKLQAVKNIVMAPDRFGLSLPDVPDTSYFVTVTTERQIDVALAAKLADMPVEDFRMLNPAHNRPVIASGGVQRINLPYDKAETFVMNLDSYREPLVSWGPYQVKSGEGLDKIAPQFGIELDELKRVNGLTGRKRIAPGFTLLVPAKLGGAPEPISTAVFREAPNDGPSFHRVRRGESLARIADRYGVTIGDLKRLNGLSTNAVSPGHRLRLQEEVSMSSGKAKGGKGGVKKKAVRAARRR